MRRRPSFRQLRSCRNFRAHLWLCVLRRPKLWPPYTCGCERSFTVQRSAASKTPLDSIATRPAR
eukprot:5628534-Alexandrium_andersonii.AAC.1